MQEDAVMKDLLDAALEIAQKRRDTLARLRAAVEAQDKAQTFSIARELCGLDDEQESDRTRPRVNLRPSG
jgi:hypothetical protein